MAKRYFKNILLFSTFLTPFLWSNITQGQNFIADGGFELYSKCPKTISNLSEDLDNVWTPTNGTTDYFNVCGNEQMGVPENFKGIQEPSQGDAYAGLYMYAPNDYREYIQFKLDTVFTPGETYKVRFDISLSESSKYGIQEMSLLFSNKGFEINTSKNLSFPRLSSVEGIKFKPIKLNPMGDMGDSDNWVSLEGIFEARGYENYLTFGNFNDNKKTKKTPASRTNPKQHDYAYYYFDNVQVEHVPAPNYEMGKAYVLDHVVFEFDHFKLTERAKRSIREVYKHLKRNPDIKLAINGHTDDLGTAAYNKYLSSRRARSVALYLIELGLPEKRISWEGHGDKKPLFKDLNDEARKANRRVEFVLTEFEDDN